jgi:hypothetical protein
MAAKSIASRSRLRNMIAVMLAEEVGFDTASEAR